MELSVQALTVRVRNAPADDQGVLPRRSAAAYQTNQSGGYETRARSSPGRTSALARRLSMGLPTTRQSSRAGTGTDCLRAGIKKASLPVCRFGLTFQDM